jgi:hypothetical protein
MRPKHPHAAESGVGKHTARESESAQACAAGKRDCVLVCTVATITLWGNCVGTRIETVRGPDSARTRFFFRASPLSSHFVFCLTGHDSGQRNW